MNTTGSDAWLFQLRVRLVHVAARRVNPDAVEDVVQDALRVIVGRALSGPGGDEMEGMPPIAWCFQVLRNTIGNHYQRVRSRDARTASIQSAGELADAGLTPLEACEADDAARRVHQAIADLGVTDAACADHLSRLADGAKPGDLARALAIDEAAFYRRLYRCREKLRARLAARGILA